MGQYHTIINLTKQQKLDPYDLGDGVKLMEFGQSGFGACFGLGLLLANDWKGDRIAIVGDYGNEDDVRLEFEDKELLKQYPDESLYSIADKLPSAVSRARELMLASGLVYEDPAPRYRSWGVEPIDEEFGKGLGNEVIVNYDSLEFLSPTTFGDSTDAAEFSAVGYSGGITTALTTLLASACKGGARGGGDIYSESKLVGSWAGDRIAIIEADQLSDDFVDISVEVRDVLEASKEGEYRVKDNVIERQTWEYNSEVWKNFAKY
jgi:hypothetical protein